MSHVKIHNVRFYAPEPRAIRCMALQSDVKKLAVSRTDASIEIWNLNKSLFIEKTIPFVSDNFSIEDIKWYHDRLFSVGLHGLLIEYDLYKLSVKNKFAVTGEAAYCLDIYSPKSQIAIGTEQGYLNIFKIQGDDILFEKFLDKQEGNIICLKFDSSGEYIVSGSNDAIRIWNLESGHAIHRLTTGRAEANKPTIVWCLEVTSDFTIISGDSRGKLTFWDGRVGAQLESYQSHQADILTLCLSEDESTLCCAGADPNVIDYAKISVKGETQWVKSIKRKIHEHDVNALIICDNKLYSGGVNSYLACNYQHPKTLIKMPPILQSPCVQIANKARYLMLRYSRHVEVWSLGRGENTNSDYRGFVALTDEPKKLLILQRLAKGYDGDKEKQGILFSFISDDGEWILLSTCLGIRLFQCDFSGKKPSLLKVHDLENKSVPCVKAVFTPNNSQLITAPNTGGLSVYDIKYDTVSISQNLESTDLLDTITFLIISECGKYLVASDPNSNIVIWSLKQHKWNKYCKLPKYQYPPTTMAVNPRTTCLVVVYSDNKLIEYDIKKKAFSPFSRCVEKNLPKSWKSRKYPIINITFDATEEHNVLILHDDISITIIDKDKGVSKKVAKAPKVDPTPLSIENGGGQTPDEFEFRTIEKYKHLVHLEWLDGDEMVAVEINPLNIIERLPPAFVQNTFGRK